MKNKITMYRKYILENVKWHTESDNSDGIFNVALETIDDNNGRTPRVDLVGYNDILRGDEVEYESKTYLVVMISRMGDMGLSLTGDLPYSIRVNPSKLKKIKKG